MGLAGGLMLAFVRQLLLLLLFAHPSLAGMGGEDAMDVDGPGMIEGLPSDLIVEVLDRLPWTTVLQLSAVSRQWRERGLAHLAAQIKHRFFGKRLSERDLKRNCSMLNSLGLASLLAPHTAPVAIPGQPISGWLLAVAYRLGEYNCVESLHQLFGMSLANHNRREMLHIIISAIAALGEKKTGALKHFMADVGYWIESDLEAVRLIAACTADEQVIGHLVGLKRVRRTFISDAQWTRRKNGALLAGVIELGHPGALRTALEKLGYDANIDYDALLLLSVQCDNLDALKALLFRLRDKEDCDLDIHALLRAACCFASSPSLLEFLLEEGADPNGTFIIDPMQSFSHVVPQLAFVLRHKLVYERMGMTPMEILAMREDEAVQRDFGPVLERRGARDMVVVSPVSPRRQRFRLSQYRRLASSLFSRSKPATGTLPNAISRSHRIHYTGDGSCALLLSEPTQLDSDLPFEYALTLDDTVSCKIGGGVTIVTRIAAFLAGGEVVLTQEGNPFIFIRNTIQAVAASDPARFQPQELNPQQL